MMSYHCSYVVYVAMIYSLQLFYKGDKKMEKIVEVVSYEENIIQLKLTNVPKHPMLIAKYLQF